MSMHLKLFVSLMCSARHKGNAIVHLTLTMSEKTKFKRKINFAKGVGCPRINYKIFLQGSLPKNGLYKYDTS